MLEIREALKDLLKFLAEKTNGDTEKKLSEKSICSGYSKLSPEEIKNWLSELASGGFIKEISTSNPADFKLYSITQKGLGL